MTEPGRDSNAKPVAQRVRRAYGSLRRPVSWKALIAVAAAAGLAVALFVALGGVDVSADRPDGWAATHMLHFVFKRSISARAQGVVPPADLDAPSRVRLAAQHFDMVCANCHGRPGFGQSVVALSMSPRPQYLPKVVGQFTAAQLRQVVAHGVKYSGMPSWATGERDDEVWSMVAFLRRLPTLDAADYRALTAPVEGGPGPAASADGAGRLRPANARRAAPPAEEFAYAAPASGFSDPAMQQNPAATCARCHGADGSGRATGGEAPDLTLQDAGYLRAALEAYSRGDRASGFMQTIAAQLSDAQIAALSAHYAGLPAQGTPPPADAALAERGRAIAAGGVRERAIPACAVCHESAGSPVIGAPHIGGQSATYLRRQLAAMRRGGRGSTVPWNPMPAEAHELGDADIDAVAAYYSGLRPAKALGGQAAGPLGPGPRIDLARARATFETRCVKCHVNGGRGDRAGGVPDLTLQSATYVAQNLYSFRTGARANPMMRELINGLSFDEMASLAAYVGGLEPQPALARPGAAAAGAGAAIARQGLAGRGVPACLSCHDARGTTALPLIPRLNGQSAPYLAARLEAFAKPYAALSPLNPMPAIAGKLTAQERASLAAYFSAAPPLAKPAANP